MTHTTNQTEDKLEPDEIQRPHWVTLREREQRQKNKMIAESFRAKGVDYDPYNR